jgi:hypothetical protein
MSIYSTFPLPAISYAILHRPAPGVARTEYVSTILDMHRAVEEESARFGGEHDKLATGLSQRQAQILRGALSQFLETPIRSDDAEVQKIFQEAFDEHRSQDAQPGPNGAYVSWGGAAVNLPAAPAWLKRLEANGLRERRLLGLEPPKGGPEAYESVYVVRGGVNLDVLEHVVRDRMGIYASAHGKHIGESAPFVVAAHNMVHAAGSEFWKALPSAWGEAVLSFDKTALPYESFRSSITTLIDSALAGSGSPSATLWQRKLGLGRGNEFILRFLLPSQDAVTGLLDGLRSAADPPYAKETFGVRAALMVKELFHPRIP